MDKTKPFLSLAELIVLALVGTILIVTLLLPPIVGLADNGDFYKMMSKFGLEHGAQTREDRYFNYVDSTFVPDPQESARYQRVWGKTLVSSEILFVAAAVWLNKAIHSGGVFHIQSLGLVHIAGFMIGALLLLTGTRNANPLKRMIGIILSIVMFVDVAYTSYFNSAYTETASFLFLMLLIGVALPAISNRPLASVWILLYFLFSFLLCYSRYPNAVMYPLLALFGIILAIHSRRLFAGLIAAIATIAGCFLLWGFIRSAPPEYMEFSVYNHFFNALLPFSPDPIQDLKEFGLDPSLLKYSRTTYFQPGSAVYDAEASRAFRRNVNAQRIVRFYLRHPYRMWQAMVRSASKGMSIRPGYGNYEKSAGKPPGAVSEGFAIWSSYRELLIPKSLGMIAIVLFTCGVIALLPGKSLCESGFRLLLVLVCALQFAMISCTSEPSDMIRHMFLFNVLFDLLLMIAFIDLLFYAGARFVESKIVKEGYPD